jgi:hypothetical protein
MRTKKFVMLLILAAVALPGLAAAEEGSRSNYNDKDDSQYHKQQNRDYQMPRGRMAADPQAQEQQEELRGVLNKMLKSAVGGDAKNYIEHLAKESRERLSETDYSAFKGVSDAFRSEWKNRYGASFDETASRGMLPMHIRETGDKIASATVKTSDGDLNLELTKEGLFGGTYKVAAPRALDGATLKNNLQAAAQMLSPERFSWPKSAEQAYEKVAFSFLKPVSVGITSSPHKMHPGDSSQHMPPSSGGQEGMEMVQ